ncbi:UNVERIFIED_CONTAM: Double-stranded RNA-binding protein 3 [Sesamum angustifolium]|uniref:Double-stranded RNA-binding protein 3 n=1 Tax=Sesamum angustifolium TaxID=2727405 RepID=A0AAW2NL38_9LAMI
MGRKAVWGDVGSVLDHPEGQLSDNDGLNGKDGGLGEMSPEIRTTVDEGDRAGIHPRRSSWGRKSGSWEMSPEVLALASRMGEPNRTGGSSSTAQKFSQTKDFQISGSPSSLLLLLPPLSLKILFAYAGEIIRSQLREGPDHAPRFKASVNFNGEIFESPTYSTTLRQAEHAAAEVALNSLSARGPSRSLTARVLIRPGHAPVFASTVELAGMNFTGESAKTKKQAEKNAAIAAWSALKRMPNLGSLTQTSKETEQREDQDHVIVARVLSTLGRREESRVIRRRDQYQPRGRMQRPHRDNNLNTTSAQQRPWDFMDPFLDPSLESCRQKPNSFLSLLPPPPPRTMSRIFPPILSKECPPLHQSNTSPGPLQVMGSSQAKIQETPAPLFDEHQRDDLEWINKISEAIKKKPVEMESGGSHSSSIFYGGKAVYNPFTVSSCRNLNFALPDQAAEGSRIHKRSDILDPITPSQSIPAFKGPSTSCGSQMGRSGFSGVHHPLRIAPEVQIRSVIPVCAAPPVRLRPSTSTKEGASGSPPSTSSPSSSSSSSSLSSSVELASSLSKLKL